MNPLSSNAQRPEKMAPLQRGGNYSAATRALALQKNDDAIELSPGSRMGRQIALTGRVPTHRRKNLCVAMKKNNGPRLVARNSKLRALTPHQRRSLRQWLLRERLTYAEARARLRKKFGVVLSQGTLSRFWNLYCGPRRPSNRNLRPAVLLDVILRSTQPIRVTVLQNNARLFFKVGRQRKRGLDKKADFYHLPSRWRKSQP